MKSGTIASIVVALLIAIGALLFVISSPSSDEVSSPTSESQQADETSSPAPSADEFSGATLYKTDEVAQHSTEDDCWTYINNVVYDITPYIPRHPGGDDILLACGGDGSTLFNQRTSESGDKIGSGMPHSSRAAGQLADLQIGIIDLTEE